jgi:hypothetical protein
MEKNLLMDAFKKQNKDRFENKFSSDDKAPTTKASTRKQQDDQRAEKELAAPIHSSKKPVANKGAEPGEGLGEKAMEGADKETGKEMSKEVSVDVEQGSQKQQGSLSRPGSAQQSRSRPGSAQQSRSRPGSALKQSRKARSPKVDENEWEATAGKAKDAVLSPPSPPEVKEKEEEKAEQEQEGRSQEGRQEEPEKRALSPLPSSSSPPPPPPPDDVPVESIVQFGVEASGLTRRGDDAVDVVMDFLVEGKHSGQTERLDAVVDRPAAFRKTWKIRASSAKDRNLRFAVYRLPRDAQMVKKMWQVGEGDLIGHVSTTLNTFIDFAAKAGAENLDLPLESVEGAGAAADAKVTLRLLQRKVTVVATVPTAKGENGEKEQRRGEGDRGGDEGRGGGRDKGQRSGRDEGQRSGRNEGKGSRRDEGQRDEGQRSGRDEGRDDRSGSEDRRRSERSDRETNEMARSYSGRRGETST